MDFDKEKAYAKLTPEKDGEVDVVTLPAGTTLYRTSVRGVPTESTQPVFLGDRTMVTTFYGNRGMDRRTLFQYTTTTPAKLMVMTLASLRALAKGDDTGFVQTYYLDPRTELTPEIFKGVEGLTGKLGAKSDTPVVRPAVTTREGDTLGYANRDLATLVCARGFDGWIVYPESVVEYSKAQGIVAMYSPEVVLCPGAGGPPTIANLGPLNGGRRIRSKTGRRGKKATRRGRTVRS